MMRSIWSATFGATFVVVCVLSLTAMAQTDSPPVDPGPADPVLYLDPIDPATGRAAVIVPLSPWIQQGPDGILGTEDDLVDGSILGDVDLVVRAGTMEDGGTIPRTSPERGQIALGVAMPFGTGASIPFFVFPTDGRPGRMKQVAAPSYWSNTPILATAFADFDGDGFIGVTHLDGDETDARIEIAELDPIGNQYAIADGDHAAGRLALLAGGPPGARLRVAIASSAYAGEFDPQFLGGLVPDGPAILTRMPFLPITEPTEILRQGYFGLLPAKADGRMALQLVRSRTPDPADPRIGEAFTLHLDGSDPTIGVAEMASGEFTRFGVALDVRSPAYTPRLGMRIRPGVMENGKVGTFETTTTLHVEDDGDASERTIRIVALDALGNIAAIPYAGWVTARTKGVVRITRPDTDGNPFFERVWVADDAGVEITLDDSVGEFDDLQTDHLVLEGASRRSRIDLYLPGPDLNEDRKVSDKDLDILVACEGTRMSGRDFNPLLDLNADGIVDEFDRSRLTAHLGRKFENNRKGPKKKGLKRRGWKQPRVFRPEAARDVEELEYDDEVSKDQAKTLHVDLDKSRLESRFESRLGHLEKKQIKLRKRYCAEN